MQADLFYATDDKNAIPLYLIPQTQWEKKKETLEPREQLIFASCQFQGKLGHCCIFYKTNGAIEKAYIGMGDVQQDIALAQAALLLPIGCYQLQESLTENGALMWALAQYRFEEYKQSDWTPRQLISPPLQQAEVLALVKAVFLTRDLINRPTNDLGPEQLAAEVAQLATLYGGELQQWVGTELLSANFPAIHAVGRASQTAPRLIKLTWGEEHHPRVTLVGKGVCFDSGGLDVKPSSSMRLMKKRYGRCRTSDRFGTMDYATSLAATITGFYSGCRKCHWS